MKRKRNGTKADDEMIVLGRRLWNVVERALKNAARFLFSGYYYTLFCVMLLSELVIIENGVPVSTLLSLCYLLLPFRNLFAFSIHDPHHHSSHFLSLL